MTPRLLRFAASAAAATMYILAAGHTASTQQPAQQVPGAIRSRITLVPVDVRVLDRDGAPVTDLRQEDFTILEDGVPQKIGHFSFQRLSPEAPGPARPSLRKELDASVEEQRHRTFLIVLGRGRLQNWSGGYEAVIRFVREQLLPQDKVAIAAWNRATDFTTDHARLVPLLGRLRDKHMWIEQRLRLRESGLEAVYGSKDIPERLQVEIDTLFDDETLRPRELAAVRIRDEEGYENAMRRQIDAVMERMLGERRALSDPRLEDFFRIAALGQSTMATLYSSIEYLKYFDGEKHLILLNEGGIFLPRAEDDEGVAATASDARVAVHTILTGGVPLDSFDMSQGGPGSLSIGASGRASPLSQTALATATGPFGALFAMGTMRTFATRSGGYFAVTERAARVFDRIDTATRAHYVLGYYPSHANWDGDYRKIEVKVNRPRVKVASRRGYFATDQIVPFDRRQFLTHLRIGWAGYYPGTIEDITLTLKARTERGDLVAEGTIDPSRLSFEPIEGIRGGEVDLAIFVGDRDGEIIGERWQTISLKLGDESFRRATQNGIPFTVRIPLKGTPRDVKAIVYDYASDLMGSAVSRVR